MVDIQDEIDAFREVLTEIAEYLADIEDELNKIGKMAEDRNRATARRQGNADICIVETVFERRFRGPVALPMFTAGMYRFPVILDPDLTFSGPL